MRPRTHLLVTVLIGLFNLMLVLLCLSNVQGSTGNYSQGLTSTKEVIRDVGPEVRHGLKEQCEASGLEYPPDRLWLIGLKKEGKLEVWGKNRSTTWRLITSYFLMASSGDRGPKLREGDKQIPEGVYSVVSLNPNSDYHLSMKLNYPNGFERRMARKAGRRDLGGNIFIHGSYVSAGCLAIGNENIEKLFVLVHDSDPLNTRVLIAPYDFQEVSEIRVPSGAPDWTSVLYQWLWDMMKRIRSIQDQSVHKMSE